MGNCMGSPFQDVTVHLKSLWLENANLSGGTFNVGLLVENPNIFSVDVTKIDCKLSKVSDGTEIADAALSDLRLSLPAKGSTTTNIKVHVSFRGIGGAAASIVRGGGKVKYRVSGKIRVASSKTKGMTVPFSSEDTFDVFEPLKDDNGNINVPNPQALK